MTDTLNTADLQDEGSTSETDELSLLKQRARLMGLTFSNNISLEKLKERIAAKLAESESDASGDVEVQPVVKSRQQMLAEQMKLVRIRVTCLDPKKASVPGEILTIANDVIGTVRKFVPFGSMTDDGYHVPYCIYRMMKRRKFLSVRTVKDKKTGVNHVEHSFVPEFALEVLPQLTQEELDKLAAAQAAAGGV